MEKNRVYPLRARLRGRIVSITVDIDTLAFAANEKFKMDAYNPDDAFIKPYRVINKLEFAKDFVLQCENEKEDGSTPISDFFDKMIDAVVDDGSVAIAYPKQDGGGEL